ncbi:hypothetical protein G3T14_05410 [Methylobacterium sp. BTF04]|nr:hypothetical protein [Methylobacterium sp. BTF04]
MHAPPWNAQSLEDFVEDAINDKVSLVAVVGHDCRRVEDVIEELIVGDGSDDTRRLTSTSHPDESIDEVRAFVSTWTLDLDPEEPIKEVYL